MSYMNQNKKTKKILESAQYGLEIIFNVTWLAGDVKEPTHISLRVGMEFPLLWSGVGSVFCISGVGDLIRTV